MVIVGKLLSQASNKSLTQANTPQRRIAPKLPSRAIYVAHELAKKSNFACEGADILHTHRKQYAQQKRQLDD